MTPEEIERRKAESKARRQESLERAKTEGPKVKQAVVHAPQTTVDAAAAQARSGSTKAPNAWFTPGQKRDFKRIVPATLATLALGHAAVERREKVKKRDPQGRRDGYDRMAVGLGAVGGTGAAYTADSVVGAGLKQLDHRQRMKFKAKRPDDWAEFNRTERAHGLSHGLKDERGRGRIIDLKKDPETMTNRAKNDYFRTYPKRSESGSFKMPGGWAKRVNSHRDMKLKTVLATGALLGGGGVAARQQQVKKKDDRRGTAAQVYGAGALVAAANYNTPERLGRRKAAKLTARTKQEWESIAGGPKGPEFKSNVKRAQGAYQSAREGEKHFKPPIGQKGKVRLVLGGIGTGVPALYLGGRSKIDKAYTRRDYDKDAAAAVAGGAIPHALAAGTKRYDRKLEAKVMADPVMREKHNAHRAAHGSPKEFGDSRWNKLYETYPKDVTGGRYRRIAARTLAGKGILVTTAAGAGGAVAVRRQVSKRAPGEPFKLMRHLKDHKVAYGLPIGVAGAAQIAGDAQGSEQHRGRNAAVAAGLGQGAYRGAGYGAKGIARRAQKDVSRSQREKILSEARHKAGVTGGMPRGGTEDFNRVMRNVPKGSPGWKATRFMAHTAGRRGLAVNTAVTAAPAAVVLARPSNKNSVGKRMDSRDERAHKLRRHDQIQLGAGSIGAALGFASSRGRGRSDKALRALPGVAAAGQAAYDLRQDAYGWSPKMHAQRRRYSEGATEVGKAFGGTYGGLGGFGAGARGPRRVPRGLGEGGKFASKKGGAGYGTAGVGAGAGTTGHWPRGTWVERPLTRAEKSRMEIAAESARKHRVAMSRREQGLPTADPKRPRVFGNNDPRYRPHPSEIRKSREYGYMDRKRSVPRTVELGAGLGLGAWGASRLRLSPLAAFGMRVAEKNGGAKEVKYAMDMARSMRNMTREVTGRGEAQARRIKQLNSAIEAVPQGLRAPVATAAGALLVARAVPTHDERFTPTGRF